MKKLILFALMFIIVKVYGQNSILNLIPQPVDIQQSEGSFILTRTSSVSFDTPDSRKVAEMLVQKLNVPTGFSLQAKQGKIGAIQIILNKVPDAQIGKEGYTFVSSTKGVVISANEPAGLFYGTQTLLQLFPKEIESKTAVEMNWIIPAVKIIDYPRFGWRGIMLDVSRNFFSKEDVKLFIDQIARFKYNTFHWHLTDDNGWRIEIKSLPKLTEVGAWRVPRSGYFGERSEPKPGEPATDGGFYTQSDIKEIILYAQERYITIVPEIDVPGHSMAAIAAYPELSCTKDTNTKVDPGTKFADWYNNGTFKMNIDNSLNPSDEKVYEFLDKIFTEVAALFPNQYIHVGGDECYKGYWKQDAGCQAMMKKLNIRHVEDLQGYFMNRVEEILKAKGKKLLCWQETLEGDTSPDAALMSWHDRPGIPGGLEATKMGHYVVMTPTTFAYLDYQQGEQTIEPFLYATLRLKKCYSFDPVPKGAEEKYILGGQGNLWTELVPTLRHAEYMTWPRGWALAEDFWSPNEKKNWINFVQRVEAQFARNEIAEINYSKAIYDPIITTRMQDGRRFIEMESEMTGLDIYYTINNTMPDRFSPKYTSPFELPDEPVTLRVITYRNVSQIGHLIILNPEILKRR